MQRTCSTCSTQFHYNAAPDVTLGACPNCETLQLLPAQETAVGQACSRPGSMGPSLVQLETAPTKESVLMGLLALFSGGLLLAAMAHAYAGLLVTLLGLGDPIIATAGVAVILGTLISWMVLHSQSTWASVAFLLLSGVVGGWLLRLGLRKLAPVKALMALRRLRHAPAASVLPGLG